MKKPMSDGADPASAGSVLLPMWMDLTTVNTWWRYNNYEDFLIESMVMATPMPGGFMETTLRKFKRIELICSGIVYTQANLYPGYDVVTDTKKLNNLGAEQIYRLTEVPLPAGRLRVTLRLDSSYRRYRAQDQSVLSLEWDEGALYAYYYPKESPNKPSVMRESPQHLIRAAHEPDELFRL